MDDRLKKPMMENPNRKVRSYTPYEQRGPRWIKQHTAMLVIHGIGNQLPLATLDGFARGIAETFRAGGNKLCLEHRFVKVQTDGSTWFDNYIRIKREEDIDNEDAPHLDIYEYYWAHHAHNRATLSEVRLWIRDTVKQAKKFYTENGAALNQTTPESRFLGKNGKLHWWRYSAFLTGVGLAIPVIMWLLDFIPKLIKLIPYKGSLLSSMASEKINRLSIATANVIGDVVIYNTTDAKSEYFEHRREILNGAVASLRRLVEPPTEESPRLYQRVILAGHSLGSQIAFDAINRLNHFITQGDLRGVSHKGEYHHEQSGSATVADVLCGFITFGSPLDKIAFFLSEKSDRTQYLRTQMLRNYHCFKQRTIEDGLASGRFQLQSGAIPRLFDSIRWFNYHDRRDYISGSLDFYEKVVNVGCDFTGGNMFTITHGNYWDSRGMFAEIIEDFLLPAEPLKHSVVMPTPEPAMVEPRRWRLMRWRKKVSS